jgi:hypothetical protein
MALADDLASQVFRPPQARHENRKQQSDDSDDYQKLY